MTWDSSEKYRHKGQRLVTDIADRGVTTSHHQPTASYGPKVSPEIIIIFHLQNMKAMSPQTRESNGVNYQAFDAASC